MEIDNYTKNMIRAIAAYAVAHDQIELSHLCTAATLDEQWAIERIVTSVRGIDVSRPDGATARKFEL